MNKWSIGLGILVLLGGATFVVMNSNKGASEVEYRFAPVAEGEVLRSTSATGTLVPLTQVDVKSKAGGTVVKMNVQEGSVVKKGDVIAVIDPADTRSVYDQAAADVTTSQVRVDQAKVNLSIEERNAVDRVINAQVALELAKNNLAKAEMTARAQPALTTADVGNARASLESAQQALRLFNEVTAPQTRRDAKGQYSKAKADLDTAQSEMTRQERLFELGYVSQSDVDRQRSALAGAKSAFSVAEQRQATIESEIETQRKSAEARVAQAQESLNQAIANKNKTPISQRDLAIARDNVRSAEVALSLAQTQKSNVALRKTDVQSAIAGAVKSRVAMSNAQTQLDSTTVIAPRDGIVTTKYLEEGTIIPPGTSTFAQGTSLVQIADTTQMEVECAVDEADIASVRVGQKVRTVLDAYPGETFDGEVKRVFPSAATAQSVTTVKVRVSIIAKTSLSGGEERAKPEQPVSGKGPGKHASRAAILRPGMNATCEFIQFAKTTINVPQQAIKHEGDQSYVLVKGSDPKKPEKRIVKVGQSGNDSTEILEGLKVGEEVVVAEIDLSAMRERQAKMEQSQQGQGSLGSINRGGPSRSRATNGGSGASK